ncbi:hypothetical protein QR680_014782 [Steinernema hermaphroditum]|uniref:Uncharacterized protein n=1 Tax=Steinernema hermaphroditum TaxID=289476 RepID=A0AA39ICA6_9BILA|nr:hypothetical protein QR680_014782 [Steinernema hermaphroditum]
MKVLLLALLLAHAQPVLGRLVKGNYTCYSLPTMTFKQSTSIDPNKALEVFAALCNSPLQDIPKVGIVFSVFDSIFKAAGVSHEHNPVLDFLEEFREGVMSSLNRIYDVIIEKHHENIYRELVLKSEQSKISMALWRYARETDDVAKASHLCAMCRHVNPVSILQTLSKLYINPQSPLLEGHFKTSHHGQKAMNNLRVEMQKIVLLLVNSARMCTEVLLVDKNLRREEKTGVILEAGSQIVPDFLKNVYINNIPGAWNTLQFPGDEGATYSAKQLYNLAVETSDAIGIHFNITISIIFLDYAYSLHVIKEYEPYHESRFWRVDLVRSKAFIFAVGTFFEKQSRSRPTDRDYPYGLELSENPCFPGALKSSAQAAMRHSGGKQTRYKYTTRYNFLGLVKQPIYNMKSSRVQPYGMYGVDKCVIRKPIQGSFWRFWDATSEHLVYFAVQFMDDLV